MHISADSLNGTVVVPPSKSYAHRAIMAASLAQGTSLIQNVGLSEDITATINAMQAFGARISSPPLYKERTSLTITGISSQFNGTVPTIDCHESGSTLRFVLPVALALCGEALVTGSDRLAQRSLTPYQSLFAEKKIRWQQIPKQFPIHLKGALHPGDFPISGSVSSQLISGLMFALPLLDHPSVIRITDSLESSGYVTITRDVLSQFGIAIKEDGRSFLINSEPYRSNTYTIEGDWSQAAFLLLMGVLGGRITIRGLNRDSKQGDRAIKSILTSMNGQIYWNDDELIAEKSKLTATTVDVAQCPDLAPVIAGAMALADGKSVIKGGKRLRDKESDRITSVANALNSLGADVTETEDGMIIRGVPFLRGGSVSSHNDHRLAMLLTSLSVIVHGRIHLQEAHAVAKSWPDFYHVFQTIGGCCNE
ncbi:3-phosphoshikimate 1-carboxyvinyltransferase [Sporolactobacillus sp. STSJ-5]|uniref:3-phosphoshikimate 1-carboxyvinyltransferase n=1 Tax=Sporolactobacillus sp. STSJ-5 TaxID=2965076 RepID=UPI0021028973|nr:3-phosphoshikimate 1-carboxyvinyltransferase [Sporolactobacillus sp. STSJ-5]MCQ2010018.1 3-phosphoshikimate 1-carboxyvinyltransferase [Sporolactobacillus sp. STSJ-5]